MKSIDFEQRDTIIGKDQPQYHPIYAFNYGDAKGHLTFCFALDRKELDEVNKTGKLWLTTMTYGQPFQPIHLSPTSPFDTAEGNKCKLFSFTSGMAPLRNIPV